MKTTFFVICLIAATLIAAGDGLRLQLIHPHSVFPTDLRGPLTPLFTITMLVNVSIGEPAMPQLLMMDTGSHVTWIKCVPCPSHQCDGLILPTYDPTKSSTFTPVFDYQGKRKVFNITYADGQTSAGTIGLEKLTFVTFDEGLEQLPNASFGCVDTLQHEILEEPSGLLGLVKTGDSVFSRWNNFTRFSYCIGNISDPNYKFNSLIVGDGAIIQGDTVPMSSDRSYFYKVTLDGISVGDKEVFKGGNYPTMVIIDSGTTYTYLAKYILDNLKTEVSELLKDLNKINIKEFADTLCYRGNLGRDLKGFPTIHLNLGGVEGAIELDIEGAFHQIGNEAFCLAFRESAPNGLNILGIIAQQYYNIGYNLLDWTLSIERIDCELLEG